MSLLENPLHLCMGKLYARWVPRLLIIDQKRLRVTTLKQNWPILTAIVLFGSYRKVERSLDSLYRAKKKKIRKNR